MDLRDPDRLRAVVTTAAEGSAAFLGFQLTQDAIDVLVEPGLDWDPDELADVGVDQLRDAIMEIMRNLFEDAQTFALGRRASGSAMRRARSRSRCHYLWFC